MLLLAAVLAGAALFWAPTPARADFIIRATDLASGGGVNASVTQSGLSNADGSGSLVFNSTVGNFSITLVTNIATTGPGFTAASQTINITYNGPTVGSSAGSDTLIIEILGNKFTNPSTGSAQITSNSSPSTSGLLATNGTNNAVVMTSGVISGNVLALGAAGTTLGGQLGQSTGSGTMGGASSVLNPNPATGAVFNIPNPFTFYQTYTIKDFQTSGQAGSLSGGSTVNAVPAPAGLILALTGVPLLGLANRLRRRKTLQAV